MRLSFLWQSSRSQGFGTSQLFDERTFYQRFLKDAASCHNELIIESPFMTTRRLNYLLPHLKKLVNRGVKVVINTRHPSEHEEYLKSEAETAITWLQNAGVTILFTGGHHRKLAIVDRTILWEGSLNILSYNESCEIMRRIDSTEVAQSTINFLRIEKYVV
jgi:PLD-like domain